MTDHTEANQREMAKRLAMRRRHTITKMIKTVGEVHKLPALSTVQKVKLIDHLLNVRGDLPDGYDLWVLHRYVNRVFFDPRSLEES